MSGEKGKDLEIVGFPSGAATKKQLPCPPEIASLNPFVAPATGTGSSKSEIGLCSHGGRGGIISSVN